MRKSDLIESVSAFTNLHKADVRAVIENVTFTIQRKIAEGEIIYLRGFGTFTKKVRKAKIGRNVKRGVSMEVPEHSIPFFKPARSFKEKLL